MLYVHTSLVHGSNPKPALIRTVVIAIMVRT